MALNGGLIWDSAHRSEKINHCMCTAVLQFNRHSDLYIDLSLMSLCASICPWSADTIIHYCFYMYVLQ